MDKHNVRPYKNIVLANDRVIKLYPPSISQLREINRIISRDEISLSSGDIDNMSDLLMVLFERIDQKLVEDVDELEDLVDISTFKEIMAFALGKANDEVASGDGIQFEDIPLSEMEAILLVEGVGGFTGFEHIEEALSIDELLLLHEQLAKSRHAEYQFLASLQGIEMPDMEASAQSGPNDLPDEVLAAEREWQKKKQEHLDEEATDTDDLSTFGLGYARG